MILWLKSVNMIDKQSKHNGGKHFFKKKRNFFYYKFVFYFGKQLSLHSK